MVKFKVSFELETNESKEYIGYEIRKKISGNVKELSISESYKN